MKFTDKFIANLKPEGKIRDIREGEGFGVRVLPSGIKTFFYIYRIDGERKFLNLGHYDPKKAGKDDDNITVEEARSKGVSLKGAKKLYYEAKAMVDRKLDPKAEKERKEEERRNSLTVAELVKEYLERHAKRFKRSWQEDERCLNREVIPTWGKRKVTDIKRGEVRRLLDAIIDRGSPVMANNTFKIVRKMFNYAVDKDILQHSPVTGVKLPSPKVERDRALSEAEIKNLWDSLDQPDLAMSPEVKRALRLVLVTAQRPGEVAGMHTREIDGRWWTIPTERAKNKEVHRVYLTDTALELIGDTQGKGYIFPCPHKKKEQPINRHALSKAVIKNCPSGCVNDCEKCDNAECKTDDRSLAAKNRFGIKHFTPHDLRRTAATFMAKLGEMDEVIDALLNHKKKGVTKVYIQYRYDKEKQKALEAWERKLSSIVSGKQSGTVIPIHAGGKR